MTAAATAVRESSTAVVYARVEAVSVGSLSLVSLSREMHAGGDSGCDARFPSPKCGRNQSFGTGHPRSRLAVRSPPGSRLAACSERREGRAVNVSTVPDREAPVSTERARTFTVLKD